LRPPAQADRRFTIAVNNYAAVVAVGTENFRDPRAGSRVALELESSLRPERISEPALDLD